MSPLATRRASLTRLGALGFAGTALATLGGCGTVVRALREETRGMASPGPSDRRRAETAWRYFRSTRNGATGLCEAVAGAGFASATSIADQIAAALCAYRLGVVSRVDFDAAMSALLAFLARAPLAGGALPGRFYAVATGALIDPPAASGDPGWSGIQLGRLLLWLRALTDRFEQYRVPVARIVARWRICDALDDEGRICEGLPGNPQGLARQPEIGAGYAIYAEQGYRAWGLSPARTVPLTSDFAVTVEGQDFAIGGLGSKRPPLQIMPYALLGLELGWKGVSGSDLSAEKALLARMFDVQDRRRARTGVLTARADFKRTSAPYALIGGIVAGGTPWGTVGEDGTAFPEFGLLATKASFAMWALGAPGAKETMAATDTLFDGGGGWLEGRYETSGAQEWTRSAATNAVVLEALLYRELGPVIDKAEPAALTPDGMAGFACPQAR